MKVLKFRAWDLSQHKFTLNTIAANAVYEKAINSINDIDDSFIINQYIGRKDKNGTLIYTDDIVDFLDYSHHTENEWINRGIVGFDEENVCFYFSNRESFDMDEVDWDKVEVVGNIHEQPDLLKI